MRFTAISDSSMSGPAAFAQPGGRDRHPGPPQSRAYRSVRPPQSTAQAASPCGRFDSAGRHCYHCGMIRPSPWLVLLLPVASIAAWFALGLNQAFSLHALAERHAALRGWAAAEPVTVAAAYVGVYAALVAACLPVGLFMTVRGGLLVGTAAGLALAMLGATSGAVVVFLLARGALAQTVARRAGPRLEGVLFGLRQDGFTYLLAMRLMPVMPFWLTNLAPGLAGLRLRTFIAATVVGVVPFGLVLASIGAGLASVLDAGGEPDLSILRSPAVVLPLLGMTVLSLLPAAWRRWRRLRP